MFWPEGPAIFGEGVDSNAVPPELGSPIAFPNSAEHLRGLVENI